MILPARQSAPYRAFAVTGNTKIANRLIIKENLIDRNILRDLYLFVVNIIGCG